MTKKCVVCGKEFETYHHKSKYCSGSCRAKYRRDQKLDHEKKTCPTCGEKFSSNRYLKTVFCSIKCSKKKRKVPKQEGYIIYFIKNMLNNKLYVGSTKNFKSRKIQHKSDLKLNRHKNSRLQSDHDLYGYENFEFIIVEEKIDSEKRYEREQHYIDYYDSYDQNKGYNISHNARSGMKNRKHSKETIEAMRIAHKNISDETRAKMSKSQKGKKRSLESIEKTVSKLRGKPLSEETKKKLSKSQSGSKSKHAKLSHEDVLDIRERLSNNEKQKEIAIMYTVDPSVISRIKNGTSYKEDLI